MDIAASERVLSKPAVLGPEQARTNYLDKVVAKGLALALVLFWIFCVWPCAGHNIYVDWIFLALTFGMAATSSTSGIPLDEYRKNVPPGWQLGDPKYPLKSFLERVNWAVRHVAQNGTTHIAALSTANLSPRGTASQKDTTNPKVFAKALESIREKETARAKAKDTEKGKESLTKALAKEASGLTNFLMALTTTTVAPIP